ncbi:DNA ligase [Colwelliaceae bacterium 6441]
MCKPSLALALFFLLHFTCYAQQPRLQHSVVADENISIKHYWVSEKLDGVRGYWDGKHLLTRSGIIIKTPSWFTKNWPVTPLDGELWSQRNSFQQIVSCVKSQKVLPQCWQKISLMLFDLPHHQGSFSQRIIAMEKIVSNARSPHLKMIKQTRLKSKKALYQSLEDVVKKKGEGLMLHHENAYYQVGSNPKLLKLKKYQDAEAVVIKHIKGKGKYSNMLGSLLVETPLGIQFKIGSGLSDLQRKDPPPVGATITYQYIGKTQRGVPRFASFIRIRK